MANNDIDMKHPIEGELSPDGKASVAMMGEQVTPGKIMDIAIESCINCNSEKGGECEFCKGQKFNSYNKQMTPEEKWYENSMYIFGNDTDCDRQNLEEYTLWIIREAIRRDGEMLKGKIVNETYCDHGCECWKQDVLRILDSSEK